MTIGNVLLMLLWAGLFYFCATRPHLGRWLACAIIALVGTIEPLYVSGWTVTLKTTMAIFFVLFVATFTLDVRDNLQEEGTP